MDKQTVTAQQAAEILEVSPNTVKSMLKNGQFEYFMAGNRYRIIYSSLPTYLRQAWEKKKEEQV